MVYSDYWQWEANQGRELPKPEKVVAGLYARWAELEAKQ